MTRPSFILLVLLGAGVLILSVMKASARDVASLGYESGERADPSVAGDLQEAQVSMDRDRSASVHRELIAEETEEVAGELYQGEFLIGDPLDFARFRGEGRCTLQVGEPGTERIIDVVEGSFDFRSNVKGPVRLLSAQFSEVADALLDPGATLRAGEENLVYFSWGQRTVQVSVKSRKTGAHLQSVDVWRVAFPSRKLLDVDFGGKLQLGPADNDKRILERVRSPFTLPIEPETHGQFWFVAPGAIPFRYQFPESLPRDSITVHLASECTLQVWADGLIGNPEDYKVRLYRGRSGKEYPESVEPLEQYAIGAPTVIDSLELGFYWVSLEALTESFPNGLVVASAALELKAEQQQVVRLSAVTPERASDPGQVTFRISPEVGQSSLPEKVRVVPVSPNAKRTMSRDVVAPISFSVNGEWGPVELLAGEYYLVREPDLVTHHFRVEPGSRATYDLPGYALHPSFLTVLNSQTQEPIEPLSVSMWTSMNWDGEFDLQHPHEMRSFRGNTSPSRLVAPLGKGQVCIQTAERGIEVLDIEILMDRDPVVELDPPTRLGIKLAGLGDSVTLRWLSLAEYTLNGQPVEPTSKQVGGPQGILNIGLLTFRGSGDLSLKFRALPASGTLKDLEVTLQPGELTWITIDPDSLTR